MMNFLSAALARPSRRWRWLLAFLGLLILTIAITLFALPTILGTEWARRAILAQADKLLAPGRLEVERFQFSWFSPTEMSRLAIHDHQGRVALSAETVFWDRNLARILFDRPRYGTMRLPGAKLHLVRDTDGMVNLLETLLPVLHPTADTDITVRIEKGSLELKSAELDRPIVAERIDVNLRLPVELAPAQWEIELENGPKGAPSELIQITGALARNSTTTGPPDLSVDLTTRNWPIALTQSGLTVETHASGTTALERKKGRLNARGSWELAQLSMSGDVLRGDRLWLESAKIDLDISQTGSLWTIRKLVVNSDLAQLNAVGTYPPAPAATTIVDGTLDLPTLVGQLNHTLPLREGMALEKGLATLRLEAQGDADRQVVEARATVSDILARDGDRILDLRDPAHLTARLIRSERAVEVQELSLRTPFLNLDGQGDLVRGITVAGTIDLAGLQRQAGDIIDLGDLKLAGTGSLSGVYRQLGETYESDLQVDLTGFRVGGTPMIAFEEPELHFNAGAKGPANPNGLPTSWSELRVGLDGPRLKASVLASEDLQAELIAPLRLVRRDGLVAAAARGRWTGPNLAINALTIQAKPADQAEPLQVALAAEYDRDRGEIRLRPLPGSSGAIQLEPEGLTISGLNETSKRIEGGLEGDVGGLLRNVADWTGNEPHDLTGNWSFRMSGRIEDEFIRLAARLDVPDLTRPAFDPQEERIAAPITMGVRADYETAPQSLTLKELYLNGDLIQVRATGRIDDLMGQRLADFKGAFALEDEALNRFLATRVEPEASARLRPRPFHVRGALSGQTPAAILRGLDAEAGIDLDSLDVFGMRLGPTPLVVRASQGQVTIEPIRTSLNGGVVDLRPVVQLDEQGGVVLTLVPGSGVARAQINAEVSRRVLSYAAPMLYGATSVRGLVSARIDEAVVPLVGTGEAQTDVTGEVVFQNVAFYPGPLIRDLFDLMRRGDAPLLRLEQTVPVHILGDRIYQPGMALPIGKLVSIEMAGSVGFDRTLDLTVNVPIVPDAIDRVPIVGDIVGGLKITLPVKGTLSEPKIDQLAFDEGMKQLGQGVAGRGRDVGGGLLNMLNQLIPGRPIPDLRRRPVPNPGAQPIPPPDPRMMDPPTPRPRPIPPPPAPGLPPGEGRFER